MHNYYRSFEIGYPTKVIDPQRGTETTLEVHTPNSNFNNYHFFPQTHRALSRIIEQCWHDSCEARLTSLRVKKSLGTLCKSEKGKKEEQS